MGLAPIIGTISFEAFEAFEAFAAFEAAEMMLGERNGVRPPHRCVQLRRRRRIAFDGYSGLLSPFTIHAGPPLLRPFYNMKQRLLVSN